MSSPSMLPMETFSDCLPAWIPPASTTFNFTSWIPLPVPAPIDLFSVCPSAMASTSAYESLRLIEPLLLNCVKADECLKRLDSHHLNVFPTSRVGYSLHRIEQGLTSALVLLLDRTDRYRHPFRDTSLEEKCFKTTIRGCADLLSALIYILGLLEAGNFPPRTTWPDSQNLLEVYDRSIADLLGILSP